MIIEQKTDIKEIKGISDKIAKAFNKIGINNLFDLLLHIPSSYQDRKIVKICELSQDNYSTIEGDIINTSIIPRGRSSIFNFLISDGYGQAKVSIFNAKSFQIQKLSVKSHVIIFGKVSVFNGFFQFTNPEISFVYDEDISLPSIVPVYGLTSTIKMNQMRKIFTTIFSEYQNLIIDEVLPSDCNPYKVTLKEAFINLHNPKDDIESFNDHSTIYHKRIIFEELLAHNLSIAYLKNKNSLHNSVALSTKSSLIKKLISSLHYTPTNAQLRVFDEISKDLNTNIPMNRLLQGDVGSGKTLVATLSCLQAIGNGVQVAILAPTEILAEQHAENISKMLSPLGYNIAVLLGKQKAKEKKENLKIIADGSASIIIGTHAIFQKNVIYNNLCFIIIDEQHRFGVEQRLALRKKCSEFSSKVPHMLAMTATPIPRTLAHTIYADMKISIIDELPPGRTPVKTFVKYISNKDSLLPRIQEHCKNKEQVYWVCCLVNESETIECQNAIDAANYLQNKLPNLKVKLVHGQMNADEKDEAMRTFKNGEADILVATSVIEVGVDVPNAFLIVIENAERYGLAQLHQLRGRVGRGKIESFCCLLCDDNISAEGRNRINILRDSNDGFVIAQKDLELRGPGDILGARQTGDLNFRIANIIRDQQIYKEAYQYAEYIENRYPEISSTIINRWFNNEELKLV